MLFPRDSIGQCIAALEVYKKAVRNKPDFVLGHFFWV